MRRIKRIFGARPGVCRRVAVPGVAVVVVLVEAGSFAGGPAVASAAAPCGTNGVFSQSGSTASCTYTTTGQDTFTVPAGVSSLQVTAVGAAGGVGGGGFGASDGGAGGQGAKVTATLSPSSSTLNVDVGGNGTAGTTAPGGDQLTCSGGPGGANGGGAGGDATCGAGGSGGGGGATDVGTSSSLASQVLVAGGGGGGGGGWPVPTSVAGAPGGSSGGSATTGAGNGGSPSSCDGTTVSPGGSGGLGNVGSGGGSGGTGAGGTGAGGTGAPAPCNEFSDGGNGTSGNGGPGGTNSAGGAGGGGGGGGYVGGGGGAAQLEVTGSGGGGGSSFGPTGATFSTAPTGATPEVVISWTSAGPPSFTGTYVSPDIKFVQYIDDLNTSPGPGGCVSAYNTLGLSGLGINLLCNLLEDSHNPRPPNTFTTASWQAFITHKEYRSLMHIPQLSVVCNAGKLVSVGSVSVPAPSPNGVIQLGNLSVLGLDRNYGYTPIDTSGLRSYEPGEQLAGGPDNPQDPNSTSESYQVLTGDVAQYTHQPPNMELLPDGTVLITFENSSRIATIPRVAQAFVTHLDTPFIVSIIQERINCEGTAVDVGASLFPSSKLWINGQAGQATGSWEQAGLAPFLASGGKFLNGVGRGYLPTQCVDSETYTSPDPLANGPLYTPAVSTEGNDCLGMMYVGRTGGADHLVL